MQTEPGEDVHSRWRVGPREELHSILVQHLNDFEFLAQEHLADRQIIFAIALRDLLGEPFPGLCLPSFRHILRSRVFAEVRRVNQISAAFPHQRRTLPRLILRQHFRQ